MLQLYSLSRSDMKSAKASIHRYVDRQTHSPNSRFHHHTFRKTPAIEQPIQLPMLVTWCDTSVLHLRHEYPRKSHCRDEYPQRNEDFLAEYDLVTHYAPRQPAIVVSRI
jgi:hypothetical protein